MVCAVKLEVCPLCRTQIEERVTTNDTVPTFSSNTSYSATTSASAATTAAPTATTTAAPTATTTAGLVAPNADAGARANDDWTAVKRKYVDEEEVATVYL